MRLALLTALTMVAFAANSVLNRLALVGTSIDPGDFALIRLLSGAALLLAMVRWRGAGPSKPLAARLPGAATLALYVVGFSYAYVTLDAGLGALLLFGGVQITMFAGAVMLGERVPALRWIGAGVAFAGLVWLLLPNDTVAPDPFGAGLMLAAALGWGLYSLLGRGSASALEDTAWSFALAVPFGLAAALWSPGPMDWSGVGLAVVSGALTSGLGYALWYAVLPALGVSLASVAQLTVPLIAMAGGMVVLSEPLTTRFMLSAALVLGGIGLSLVGGRRGG